MSHPEAPAPAEAEGSSQAQVNREPVYEVGYHLVPTVAEGDVGAMVERIRALLEKDGGEILAQEYPKRMTLSYRIERSAQGKREKYTESWFGWIKFDTESANVPGIEAALRDMREVLRSLIIETVREVPAPTPRAVFTSDRLEGETIKKMPSTEESKGEVSEEELDKSIEALVK